MWRTSRCRRLATSCRKIGRRSIPSVTPPSGLTVATTGAAGTASIIDNDTGNGPSFFRLRRLRCGGPLLRRCAHFEVHRRTVQAPTGPVTVQYRMSESGNASPDDLRSGLKSGTITFDAGQTLAQIEVQAGGDIVAETDEVFSFDIFSPSGGPKLAGNVNTLSALGFILDEDGTGTKTDLGRCAGRSERRPDERRGARRAGRVVAAGDRSPGLRCLRSW